VRHRGLLMTSESQARPGAALPRGRPHGLDSACPHRSGLRRDKIWDGDSPSDGRVPTGCSRGGLLPYGKAHRKHGLCRSHLERSGPALLLFSSFPLCLSGFFFPTCSLERRRQLRSPVVAILRPEAGFALATGKAFRLFAVQRVTPLSDAAGLTHDRFRSACPPLVGLARRGK
jgi:hypothetical protein